jgi:hypothetical protein
MMAPGKRVTALFVDRTTRQWVVRCPEGKYWALSGEEDLWENRRPFEPAQDADLEPVPWHYKDMLGLPF